MIEPIDLAAAMLRLYLAELVLCRQEFEEESVAYWAMLYDETAARAVTREVMAYSQAKRRLLASRAGNPQNVVAVLLYNVSRSGPRDLRKMKRWEKRLARGFSLRSVRRLDQALTLVEELPGSYLSERQVGQLCGRTVNLDRVAQLVKEEWEKAEGGEGHGD